MTNQTPPSSRVTGSLVDARASCLYEESYHQLAVRSDRLFGRLLAFEWVVGVLLALWISPRVYSGTRSAIHIHLYAAVFLGFAAISLPLYLIRRAPGTAATRHTIAAAQMVLSGS